MVAVVEGMAAVGTVPGKTGHMGVVEEGMVAERTVPEVGRCNLAVEEDMVVEGVGHRLAVVEEDIVRKEVVENLSLSASAHFSSAASTCTHDPVAAVRRTEDIHPDMPFSILLLYWLNLESAKLMKEEFRLMEKKEGAAKREYMSRRRRRRRQYLALTSVQ
jgi:hypothetical protein